MKQNGAGSAARAQGLDLQGWRQLRGISLREIAETTKISLRFLQAIEEGSFELLPGGIYNISYIRQYARAIQYEEAQLLAYYHSATALVQ